MVARHIYPVLVRYYLLKAERRSVSDSVDGGPGPEEGKMRYFERERRGQKLTKAFGCNRMFNSSMASTN